MQVITFNTTTLAAITDPEKLAELGRQFSALCKLCYALRDNLATAEQAKTALENAVTAVDAPTTVSWETE